MERIQKWISACGVASRRQAEQWILEGKVTVNGAIARLGDRADPARDVIQVNGTVLEPPQQHTYLMLHKPRGYVTTLSDERGRRTVAELVADCPTRVYPVGRLDLDSEGLLLLTDDGALANGLMHPSHEVEKEYLAWVQGDLTEGLPILKGRIRLDGQLLCPAAVTVVARGETSLLSIRIHEGKNRQIRRMCQTAGLRVTRLKRVAVGALRLERLPKGKWRCLTETEVACLKGSCRTREV